MSYDNANKVVHELFDPLLLRYQIGLEISMRGRAFIFESVQRLHYKCHKIHFKRWGSYINSPDWIKKKKAAITPTNTNDKGFQYAETVALNYGEIE